MANASNGFRVTRRLSRWTAPCGLLLLLAAVTAPVHAQEQPDERPRKRAESDRSRYERARALFWQATAAYERKEYAAAREVFAKAHELEPGAAILRALGYCDYHLENYVQATQELKAALAEPRRTKALSQEQQHEVNDLLAELAPRIGRLVLETTPEHVALELDGHRHTDAELWLTAGDHTLTVSAPNYRPLTVKIKIDGGHEQRATVKLTPTAPVARAVAEHTTRVAPAPAVAAATMPLPAAPEPEPRDEEDPAAAGRMRGIVALGVGVAALLTGTATGYFSAIKTFNEQPRCTQGHCPLDSQSTLATANTLANVSNVSFAVAGVAAVYGLYELLTLPKRAPVARRARVGLTANGLSLEGRF